MSPNDGCSFFCSVCLVRASDPGSDHTLCFGCDALEREIDRRRRVARELVEMRAEIGSLATADLAPDDPEDQCAA